jgi:hypothetical protein
MNSCILRAEIERLLERISAGQVIFACDQTKAGRSNSAKKRAGVIAKPSSSQAYAKLEWSSGSEVDMWFYCSFLINHNAALFVFVSSNRRCG